MRSIIAIILSLIAASWSGVQAQNRAGTFAAAATPTTPTPAQPAAPPQAGATPGLALPRPAGQAQATQQPQEQLRVVADPATNSLIIYGTAQEFQNIKNILKELDAIPRQVLLDVMVAEVTLTDDESFGVAYEVWKGSNSIFGQTFPSTGAVSGLTIPTPPTTVDLLGNVVATGLTSYPPGISGIIGRTNTLRAFITALASQNRIKALASPSVLAMDNRPARIQVGSEIPILTGQTSTFTTGTTPLTSNTIQYRNTGVILTVIPQVNSQGLVNLQVKQEVSDVGSANFGSTGSPSFTTRDAETSAVVQDGDTLAIAGIIAERKTRNRTGIPYLMDIPVLGRFLSTTTDSAVRTELIILITPRVIRNKDESQLVTQDLKNKLFDVKNELERLARDRARTQPPPRQPPLPDPNQYYRFDPQQQQFVPDNPPAAPRAALPSFTGEVTVLANDPLSRRMMPPMLVPHKPMAIASAPVALAPEPLVAPLAPVEAQIQIAAPNVPAPVHYLLSSLAPVAPLVAPVSASAVAPTPMPRKALSGKRAWTVQVAAVGEKNAADSLAEKLRWLGYQAYVIFTQGENRSWHRVRVGQLANQKEALALRDVLSARKEHKNAYVTAY